MIVNPNEKVGKVAGLIVLLIGFLFSLIAFGFNMHDVKIRENWILNKGIVFDIDEYDERLLRHLALGYTKDMITNLKGMPFGVKSLEKRQNDLINRLFPADERTGVNACRLVTRALELRIIDIDHLEADEE